jgi:hypothetical protein
MATVQRRRFLQSVAAGLFALSVPDVAAAQWVAVGKIILEVLGGVSAAIGIGQYIEKWFIDKRCNISAMELDDLKFQCSLVDFALNAERGGAITSLSEFVTTKTADSWHRAKVALGNLLNNGNALMLSTSIIVVKLDRNTYPGSQEDITKLYSGLDQIRPALAQLASLPDAPNDDTVQLAKSVLELILRLPASLKVATVELQRVMDDRLKVHC